MARRLLRALGVALALAAPSAMAAQQGRVEKFDGYAEWRKGDLLVVDGQRIRTTSATRVELRGHGLDPSAIPLGYEVKGKGRRDAGGALVAERIEVEPNGNGFMESQLAASFDAMEAEYRRRGRVFDAADDRRIVADYGRLLESGPDVARARRIASRLVPPYLASEDFRVYVIENKDWNAMAAPNGSIYVYRGLLRDLDDDEVAIVLGHELAHATHEHSRKQVKRNLWIQLAALAPLTAVDRIDGDGKRAVARTGAVLGLLAWSNRYSRSQEDQADRVGLRYAHEAGYDVRKGPGLWRRFAQKYGGGNKMVNFFFGSHSIAASRAERLEREIALNYD